MVVRYIQNTFVIRAMMTEGHCMMTKGHWKVIKKDSLPNHDPICVCMNEDTAKHIAMLLNEDHNSKE